MLEELLALKRRREGRLRRQIAAGNQRYQRLKNSRQALIREREKLQKAWRQLGEEGRGKLARERLYHLQRQLEECFQRDKYLEAEIAQMNAECRQWLLDKQQLQQQIQQNRIDQEKLIYVLDEGLDAYSRAK